MVRMPETLVVDEIKTSQIAHSRQLFNSYHQKNHMWTKMIWHKRQGANDEPAPFIGDLQKNNKKNILFSIYLVTNIDLL